MLKLGFAGLGSMGLSQQGLLLPGAVPAHHLKARPAQAQGHAQAHGTQ